MLHTGYILKKFYTERMSHTGLSMTGKTTIVTGCYSALASVWRQPVLAAAGATLIVPARTRDKAAAAVAGIKGIEL